MHNFKKNWSTTEKILELKYQNVYWISTFINTSTTKKKKQNRNTRTSIRFSIWKIGLFKIKLCSRIHFGLVDYNGNLHNQLYLFNEQPLPADVREKDRERNEIRPWKKGTRKSTSRYRWPCFSLSFERNIAHLGQECAYNMEGYGVEMGTRFGQIIIVYSGMMRLL